MITQITDYIWDGNILLHECTTHKDESHTQLNEAGELEVKIPENLVTWVFEEGSFVPQAKLVNGKAYSIITDHLGTPMQAFDEQGKKVWACALDIYGKVRKFTGEKTFIPFRYQGQIEDEETGLYYNRFRYYSPDSGTYISQDPIGLEGGGNLYAYVHDPNNWVDPLGLNSNLECSPSKNKKTSYQGSSRRDAFRQAKRDAGIPNNQQPFKRTKVDLTEKVNGIPQKKYDNKGMPIQVRQTHFKNAKGKEIIIQEHSLGHTKATPGDPAAKPHFNVRPSSNPETGSVKGTHGHYNF